MLARDVFMSPLDRFRMQESVALGHRVKRKHSQESVEVLGKAVGRSVGPPHMGGGPLV